MYQHIGSYQGDVAALAERAASYSMIWNPPGWGSISLDPSEFVNVIPGDRRLAMILAMKPGSAIPFHRDNPAYENGLDGLCLERVHLVLTSNSACWNFHDGIWQRLDVGGLYRMDPSKEHASINLGDTVRFHLVIDRLLRDL